MDPNQRRSTTAEMIVSDPVIGILVHNTGRIGVFHINTHSMPYLMCGYVF